MKKVFDSLTKADRIIMNRVTGSLAGGISSHVTSVDLTHAMLAADKADAEQLLRGQIWGETQCERASHGLTDAEYDECEFKCEEFYLDME